MKNTPDPLGGADMAKEGLVLGYEELERPSPIEMGRVQVRAGSHSVDPLRDASLGGSLVTLSAPG